MAPELFRLLGAGETIRVPEQPFTDEVSDLEDFICDNPQLLGDGITIVDRQVTTPAGRLDLLALDASAGGGQIAVVELKKVPADVDVLLQVLRYASWVKGNQDSVRLLLTKRKINPDPIELHPRIIIVAPEIRAGLVELAQYVNSFEFSFVELQRYG